LDGHPNETVVVGRYEAGDVLTATTCSIAAPMDPDEDGQRRGRRRGVCRSIDVEEKTVFIGAGLVDRMNTGASRGTLQADGGVGAGVNDR
jgi:hypothetical protein